MTTPEHPTVITVRGRFEAHHPPERATVSLTVAHEGGDKTAVYATTATRANEVVAQIRPLVDPSGEGPATWWSSARLRTWSHRPWNQDGKHLPLVFHASVAMTVKFRDFEALSRFVDDLADVSGVSVDGIEWALTEARRLELDRDARRRAVEDARTRAQDYADAAGLGAVRVVAVADRGMLGEGVSSAGGTEAVAFARAAGSPGGAGAPPVALQPSDTTVSAAIDARFVAD